MNYSALIQNRRSVREFTETRVPLADTVILKDYYLHNVRRLIPNIPTELYFFGPESRASLEGAAGYHNFLIGAPQYMVLMSGRDSLAHLNAGYMMEDMVLKLTAMDLDSCWVTCGDSSAVKAALAIESDLEVAAIVAFGYGKKTTRRLRLNMLSMSNVDVVAKHRYMEPKRSVQDLAFVNAWGNTRDLEQHIGFFDDVLWEALYAASLAPSYLNRQAYGFLLHGGTVSLVSRPDGYNNAVDGDLSLGAVLLHFSAVAENWTGKLNWRFGEEAENPELPEGHRVVASCCL